jgi:glycosyltransferase involved in cell wall biosynthesis
MMSDLNIAHLVTPVTLTFNEAPNLERLLRSLAWAGDVVVVDSGSCDSTERVARQFPNVRWFVRRFDTHGAQWQFAIRQTQVATPYVLALDADYEVPSSFVEELARRFAIGGFSGGVAGFEYRIHGRSLMGSVYPPKLVVFRPHDVRISQSGHTQEFATDGAIYRFAQRLVHDDRKPVDRFVRSQLEYSRLEASRLLAGRSGRWQDALRRKGVMPLVAGIGAYIKSGGPFRGSAALRYVHERVLFECLLALRVLGNDTAREPIAGSDPEKRDKTDEVRTLASP